ncbi:DsbA family oxidoreductase [Proteiniphilum sp.]|uniref:DsbA family oxidoreductase n=1 Tax=Proteiniphilum sp. TaxID=1926877 RepID=UPI002B21DA6E|nr:DsbA family oxidoreductase [Proteiniphilum sp.]MEA4918026.1 DsbA family oxidoreductase [Proteiniphilum sp.]
MKIEVWTDIMCPYCHIGKTHYEKALRQFNHADEVQLEWKAYQLNADLPDQGRGIPVRQYLTEIAGFPEENMNRMFEGIKRLADDAGIPFALNDAIAANTRDAHRLIKLAAKKNLDSLVLSKLSKAYFEEGKDYSDWKLLMNIGVECGLDEEEIQHMLESDDYQYEIKQDMQEAANLGFDTVPTFLIDRRQAIIGSEPVDLFLKVLNKAYNDWKTRTDNMTFSGPEVTKGKSCNADGICEI